MSQEHQGTTCAIGSRNLHHSVMPTAPTRRAALSSRSNSSTSGLGSLSEVYTWTFVVKWLHMNLLFSQKFSSCLHLGVSHARKPKEDLQGQLTRLKGSWAAECMGLCDVASWSNEQATERRNKWSWMQEWVGWMEVEAMKEWSLEWCCDWKNNQTNQSAKKPASQPTNRAARQPTNEPSDQSVLIHPSINQSTNQPVFHIAKISQPESTIFQRA